MNDERELAEALGVLVRCRDCRGDGYHVVGRAVCCGRPGKHGECCEEPEWADEAEPCATCEGSGKVVPGEEVGP
jgi:hypothetical protein